MQKEMKAYGIKGPGNIIKRNKRLAGRDFLISALNSWQICARKIIIVAILYRCTLYAAYE